jgi:capsular polysaccharide transport system permease protein
MAAPCFAIPAMTDATGPEPDSDAGDAPRLVPQFSALRSIGALMLRETGTTYGRNPGGYVWAVLEPLGMISVMALVFSLMIRSPPLGTSFLLFYAVSYLPFDFFQGIERKTNTSLRSAQAILAYPRVTWVDVVLARAAMNVLVDLSVVAIVMIVVVNIIDVHTVIDIRPLLMALFMAGLLGLGVGLINAIMRGIFPVWVTMWGILSRALFIGSGVFFLYADLPPFIQNILWWNPLTHVVALGRTGFYPSHEATFVSFLYVFGFALTLIAFGLIVMRAWYKTALEA